MQQVYRTIKRKKNLRRFAAFWIFLLVIELFCPVFGDEAAFAAQIPAPKAQAVSSVNQNEETSPASIIACTEQDQHHEQTSCNDECLCHATAIPSINVVTFKENALRSGNISFRYGNPVFNSLPPPFEPPKNS